MDLPVADLSAVPAFSHVPATSLVSSLLLEEASRIEKKSSTELDSITMRRPSSALHESPDGFLYTSFPPDLSQPSSGRTSLNGTPPAYSPCVYAPGVSALHPSRIQPSLSSSPVNPTPLLVEVQKQSAEAALALSSPSPPCGTRSSVHPSLPCVFNLATESLHTPHLPHHHADMTPGGVPWPHSAPHETQDLAASHKTEPKRTPALSSITSWAARKKAMAANYDTLKTVNYCGWVVIQGGKLLGTGSTREAAIDGARLCGYDPKADKLAIRILSSALPSDS